MTNSVQYAPDSRRFTNTVVVVCSDSLLCVIVFFFLSRITNRTDAQSFFLVIVHRHTAQMMITKYIASSTRNERVTEKGGFKKKTMKKMRISTK